MNQPLSFTIALEAIPDAIGPRQFAMLIKAMGLSGKDIGNWRHQGDIGGCFARYVCDVASGAKAVAQGDEHWSSEIDHLRRQYKRIKAQADYEMEKVVALHAYLEALRNLDQSPPPTDQGQVGRDPETPS